MQKHKTIISASDLAVNGARPSFDKPIHVGRPNIGDRETFIKYVNEILDSRWLSNNGPLVERLEKQISELLGVKNCVAMCNGTVALEIAIRAVGLTGEVIVPSYTFIATPHALSWQGVTPVFADIDPFTHNLDPEAVRRMITPRTTGILATHLWGTPCDITALQAIADEHGLKLVFDAAHAFMASVNTQMIGNFGEAEVFSFHATKFFNTFEGGAVTTNNDDLAQTMRLMRNFGFAGLDNVTHSGTNGKMTEICAAMGLVNLDSLEVVLDANKANYGAYCTALNSIDGVTVLPFDDNEARNYQYIVIEVAPNFPVSRDMIVEALHAENILARKYFWPGCHEMKPYREAYPSAGLLLPNTKTVAERVIVMPTGSTLPPRAVETIRDVFVTLADQYGVS
jgi:dTDP-4-amino-4,6-dideoxygalactose transaminase